MLKKFKNLDPQTKTTVVTAAIVVGINTSLFVAAKVVEKKLKKN